MLWISWPFQATLPKHLSWIITLFLDWSNFYLLSQFSKGNINAKEGTRHILWEKYLATQLLLCCCSFNSSYSLRYAAKFRARKKSNRNSWALTMRRRNPSVAIRRDATFGTRHYINNNNVKIWRMSSSCHNSCTNMFCGWLIECEGNIKHVPIV